MPNDDSSVHSGALEIAGYEILGVLGRGGFGVVFRARHEATGRAVAVKVLHRELLQEEDLIKRFEREARVLIEHPHPTLVTLVDGDLRHDPPYLALEYLPGGDLESRIRRGTRCSEEEALRTGRRLAQALEHLHALGILHRDVKPANVLFDSSGLPVLADLGLVQRASDRRLTQTGAIVGTPAFLGPELLGGAEHSPASDMYALGLLLVETLDPCSSPIRTDPGRRVASLPPGRLRSLLGRCLRRDPRERPTASEFLRELDHGAASSPSSEAAATAPLPVAAATPGRERKRPGGPRAGFLKAVMAAGALAVLLVGGMDLARSPEVAPPGPAAPRPSSQEGREILASLEAVSSKLDEFLVPEEALGEDDGARSRSLLDPRAPLRVERYLRRLTAWMTHLTRDAASPRDTAVALHRREVHRELRRIDVLLASVSGLVDRTPNLFSSEPASAPDIDFERGQRVHREMSTKLRRFFDALPPDLATTPVLRFLRILGFERILGTWTDPQADWSLLTSSELPRALRWGAGAGRLLRAASTYLATAHSLRTFGCERHREMAEEIAALLGSYRPSEVEAWDCSGPFTSLLKTYGPGHTLREVLCPDTEPGPHLLAHARACVETSGPGDQPTRTAERLRTTLSSLTARPEPGDPAPR